MSHLQQPVPDVSVWYSDLLTATAVVNAEAEPDTDAAGPAREHSNGASTSQDGQDVEHGSPGVGIESERDGEQSTTTANVLFA